MTTFSTFAWPEASPTRASLDDDLDEEEEDREDADTCADEDVSNSKYSSLSETSDASSSADVSNVEEETAGHV